MQDSLLRACLPGKWNARRVCTTCVSHMMKREMHVIGACLTLGPHAVKFRAPHSQSPHLAIFWILQVLSLFCHPRPRSQPRSTPPPHPLPWSSLPFHPHLQSTLPPHPRPRRQPAPRAHLPGFLNYAAATHLWPLTPPPARPMPSPALNNATCLPDSVQKVPMPPLPDWFVRCLAWILWWMAKIYLWYAFIYGYYIYILLILLIFILWYV
jgi:hypothetical protein